MDTGRFESNTDCASGRNYIVAAAALLLAIAPTARAQSVAFDPASISRQRSAIILKATHIPLANLEKDVNHLAVLSETCRAESGSKACGLSEKALESTKLDDRYAYYVRDPVDARAGARQAKIDRHNWEAPVTAHR